jgi:branched-chain amino acid transport system substrate-binding protein
MTAIRRAQLLFSAAVAAMAVLIPQSLPAQTAPITIDAILPLTGQAAFPGTAESQTLSAFEKYFNARGGVRGQRIHFEIHDDQSTPQVALQLANAIAARKMPVILGSAFVGTCAPIGALVAASGPVQYCLTPAYTPPKDSYAFAATYGPTISMKVFLLYAKLRGFKRFAYIDSTDASGIDTAAITNAMIKQPEMRGLELVAAESIGNADVSATAQIAKIKAARPDVLFTSSNGTTFGIVMHAMSDVGLDVPVLTTTANATATQLHSLAAYLPKDLYFNGFEYQLGDQNKDRQLREQGRAFADAFAQINVQPSALHALAWDPALIILSGYRQFGASMTAQQLRTFILAQHHFAGINGYYDFSSGDQHGLGFENVVMIGWDRDKQEFFAASSGGGTPLKR